MEHQIALELVGVDHAIDILGSHQQHVGQDDVERSIRPEDTIKVGKNLLQLRWRQVVEDVGAEDVIDLSGPVREWAATIPASQGCPPLGVPELSDGSPVPDRKDPAQPRGDFGQPQEGTIVKIDEPLDD
jgi:hypothetical protein